MEIRNFSPSINIKRDFDSDLQYIPTENSQIAYNRITSSYEKGIRSFSLVGAYGSGKSTFLLALEQTLNGVNNYFNRNGHPSNEFKPIFIIGKYESLIESFAKELNVRNEPDIIIEALDQITKRLPKGKGLLLVIDEFGKFLEYAAKNNPDAEMYFVQQLAEFVNDPQKPNLFITTLHQSFNDYAISLSKTQRTEWDKVKGRLIEISFNEPVEQLLLLASEKIKQNKTTLPNQHIALLKEITRVTTKLSYSEETKEVAKDIYPLDLLAASILTRALQSYGQNERSLFSFLEADDHLGLNSFDYSNNYYNLKNVYDYLSYNFYTLINSRYVEHTAQWRAQKNALALCEATFSDNVDERLSILKTIGLLNIFGDNGQKLDRFFLVAYSSIALGIEHPEKYIDQLEKASIIKFQSFSQRYILFEGTDVDIERELIKAEDEILDSFSVTDKIIEYFDTPIIAAKESFHKTGTLRHFTLSINEKPDYVSPEGIEDGIVQLIFNPDITEKELKKHSAHCKEAVLYGLFNKYDIIHSALFEIEKAKFVRGVHSNDKVVIDELDSKIEYHSSILFNHIRNSLYSNHSIVSWFYNGKPIQLRTEKDFNKQLSRIISDVYSKTPILKNELFVKNKPSGTISSARGRLINAAINFSKEEYLGFEKDKFPPEKSIYLSLLYDTGIHQFNKKTKEWEFGKPATDDKGFKTLWEECEQFLIKSNGIKQKLSGLYETLNHKPYKLKQGFLDFFVPIFLVAKQNEYLLYERKDSTEYYIPKLTEDTIRLIIGKPENYFVKAIYLDDNQLRLFNTYRSFLNFSEEEFVIGDTFIETVKPFLSYYKRLNDYVKQTKRLSKEAIELRDALADADDPQALFFDKIPQSLGFSTSELKKSENILQYNESLNKTIKEITHAPSKLIDELESFINDEILGLQLQFPENKEQLQKRYQTLNPKMLNNKHRVFYQRLFSALDDRVSWITSLTSFIVNKRPDNFTDRDVLLFKENLKKVIYELDNIADIKIDDINQEKEEFLKLEITSFVQGLQRKLIRLPKGKSKKIDEMENQLQNQLKNNDRQTNIALLIKLLQKEINDE